MRLTPILTSIALGYGLINGSAVLNLLYKAMYTGNHDGIACIDCNKYGEGNIEIIIGIAVLLITLYIFIVQLNTLV